MSDCAENVKNLGISKCNKLPGYPKGMIEVPVGFSATSVEAVDPTFWQDALTDVLARRAYLWPLFFSTADASEASVYATTPLGKRRVRDGFYEWDFMISENLCLHKAMFTHRRTTGGVFLIDTDNNIIGREDADGNFLPLTIQMLNTEKMKFNDGANPSMSPVKLVLANNLEFDLNGAMVDGDFVGDLIRLTDVTLTIVSAAVALIVVTVKATCDGTAINGLVVADFKLVDDDNGATHALTSLTELDGTYSIVGSSFELSKLNLKAPSALTIKAYESIGAVQVTPA